MKKGRFVAQPWGHVLPSFLALLLALLIVLVPLAARAQSDELDAPVFPPEGNARQTAVLEGDYPAQLAGSTGQIQPSRFGPQRNDPSEGIPDHAYSPFDERNNREHPCPPGGCDYAPGSLVIKLAPAARVTLEQGNRLAGKTELDRALSAEGIVSLEPVFPEAQRPSQNAMQIGPDGELTAVPDLTRWYKAALGDDDADIYAAVETLAETPGVAWVEPDYLRHAAGEPAQATAPLRVDSLAALPGPGTDPLYAQQWHLAATNVPQAWAYLEGQGLPPGGSPDIVVAVIDSGIDYTHPDLAANMWVNAREFAGSPGVDDDGNGFKDDIHGVNVVGTHSGNPMDDHGHGTHVAGIIGAAANNGLGGVGVAYNVKLMGIKAAQYSGVLAATDIAEGIYYAVEQGADVINMSFGGYARSQLEEDALAVAFGQAVLVAAAGNDRKINLPCLAGRDFYPAAYNWVLGVMASTSGGTRAFFSNYDCTPHDTHEYELLAPGVDVISTLPPTNYAAWDGTSMAAPVVSGIAALARTRWADKDIYSSRFIMGQIAANAAPVADGLAALTNAPQPRLSYLEHWLFDTEAQAPGNDADGIVDAGETVDLAIVIRNHWGKADPVIVTLEAQADGAFQPDPYVTMITDTVSYGAIGSFNQDDNGLIYDAEGVITGVEYPFQFSVDPTTPNDHVIPFLLTIIAGNGYDPDDPSAPHISQSRFYMIVQRGQVLPRIISEDMTLSNNEFWIVDGPVLIESGASVTVTEGTQIQWGNENPSDPYAQPQSPYVQVEGQLFVTGSQANPVELFASDFFQDPIDGYKPRAATRIINKGITNISYCLLKRPQLGSASFHYGTDTIDHCEMYGDGSFSRAVTGGDGLIVVAKQSIVNSSINVSYFVKNVGTALVAPTIQTTLIRARPPESGTEENINLVVEHTVKDSVFLPDPTHKARQFWILPDDFGSDNVFDNALLPQYWYPNVDTWMQVHLQGSNDVGLSNNYWGTTSTFLIEGVIYDYQDNFDKGTVNYQPILTVPAESTYPFVWKVVLATASEADTLVVGAEPVTFTVTYNRDMDITVQPLVTFGPDTPQTDYTIHPIDGGWQDARTWQGTFNVTPVTGDGYQLLRIKGGRAADDHWLVAGDDVARFRFEIITSGTSAMNLQANGGEGFVDLTWSQDDFDLLAGFNVYRATSAGGTYTRINDGIIPPDQLAYRDTNVNPGQPYYYKFTIVKTDMSETDFSNTAAATPVDTVAPVISHTPVASAPPGLPLTLIADVTDNVAVQQVRLYYRPQGAGSYTTAVMVKTTGNRYAATVPGTAVAAPGLEYYLSAGDGISTVQNGRPENPHRVSVEDKPVVTGITPNSGPAAGGTAVTISGSNFQSGASVTLGGAVCGGTAVISSNQIVCTTPAHFPAPVDVTVINPGNKSGSLLNGFTYLSEIVSLSLPDTGGAQFAAVQVPLNAANVQGLAAADLTITYDPAVLSATGASTGSLTPGWSLAVNTGTPGQLRLAMASPGGTVSGSGILVTLKFDVAGAPGSSSALGIASALLNDGAITVDSAAGSFAVDQVVDVSGLIDFWNGGPLAGVTLNLEGDRLYSQTNAGDGTYTVSGAAGDSYVLTPQKSDEANDISAYDASLILQHAAGLATLSGHPATAADVNKTGTISSMDAFHVLQKSVDLITVPFPGAGVVWDFAPPTRSYPSLSSNQTGQNFTGILLGDVSGSWAPGAQQMALDDEVVNLALANSEMAPDGHVTVTLEMEAGNTAVFSADMELAYDPAKVTLLEVTPDPFTASMAFAANSSQSGTIKIGLAGAQPLSGSGRLLTLQMQIKNSASGGGSLSWRRGALNEGATPVSLRGTTLGTAVWDGSLFLPLVVK